jgi:aerobic-type carbon monoxide dehydrogenase small subunit (CoxS/CutS family)
VSEHSVSFELNGQPVGVRVPAHRLLLDLLRDDLGLTGTKEGCTIGVCGICSVLVDGALLSACLLPVVSLEGARITTIEGLTPGDDTLSPLQDAFIRYGGFQCGICTPGQIVSATALLHENPAPTREEIKHWMMGNLCRCTGYYKIAESIEAAAAMMRGEQPPPPGIA